MFDKQVTALTAILKDKDIREYSGDAFWNILKRLYWEMLAHFWMQQMI